MHHTEKQSEGEYRLNRWVYKEDLKMSRTALKVFCIRQEEGKKMKVVK